jgi:hypothetical protein
MLSAFLFGLGFGSLLIRKRADGAEAPVRLLGTVQWAMGAAALLTLPIYAQSFPVMAWLVGAVPKTEAGYVVFNLARYALALLVMLPATLLAGMTLPLITGTLLRAGAGERVIGQAYSANTVGSMIGAVGGGLVLMSRLGLERLLAFGAALDIAVGVALLVTAAEGARRLKVGALAAGAGALVVAGTLLLVRLDQRVLTSGVYRSGQIPDEGTREVLFYQDGATATIGAHRLPNGQTVITTNGKGDASLPLRWLQQASGELLAPVPMLGEGDETTQLLAPLITLAHRPEATRALVVGQGSGMSTHILLGDPLLEEVVTVEIEPEMIVGSSVFQPANRRSFEDPRGRFLLEDARRAIVQGEPLDIILSEPSNPWISGVASLFTVEFYERARARLAPGGVFGQWVHLYEIEDEIVLTILAAIDRTFPQWTAYLTSAADMMVIAAKDELPMPDWRVAEFPGIQQDLAHAPPLTPGVLESLFLFDDRTMGPLLARWEPNTDARPLVDTRAERARFLGGGAAGVFSFADHPVNVSRILSGARFAPLPYDAPPIVGIAPVERRALAGWLVAAGRSGEPAPFAWWDPAISGLETFEAAMAAGSPGDWGRWFEQFTLVEGVLHGRAVGWADSTFYREVGDYLLREAAPPGVRESVALLEGLRTLDLARAAAAADALRVTDPSVPQLIPAGVLVDAAVTAYLGAGQPQKARAVFDGRVGQTGRPPDDVRNLVLDALIDAGGPEPR